MISNLKEANEWYDIYKRRAKHSLIYGTCVISLSNRIYRCTNVVSHLFDDSYYELTEINTEGVPTIRKVKASSFENMITERKLLYYDQARPLTYESVIKQMDRNMFKK